MESRAGNETKEALRGLTVGVILMIVGFAIAHYVFGMPFFPN
ncbi:hypothetical protein ACFPU1_08895 [Thalassorhabdus alkalitolerans]|uniref:Uncharacterized protein n=1 Tax=Thalassorhabdus alkalitolerans TaxID=2282697 RepID=A0ABW0YQ90_9BACI|nr:hypothetical protein [Bacillus sp. FJAT-44742]